MKRLLPLLTNGTDHRHGARSLMTCEFRCANQCDHPIPNTSGNSYFGDLAEAALTRRSMLGSAAAGAFALGVGGLVAGQPGTAAAMPAPASGPAARPGGRPYGVDKLDWESVAANTADAVTIPPGFQQAIVVSWGDPVVPGAPTFDFDNQTGAAQEQQYGTNCDFLSILPLPAKDRALLVSNHEYSSDAMMFRGWTGFPNATAEQVKVAMAAHGLSVVEIERVGSTGQWRLARDGKRTYNRRITATTRFEITGGAAGDPLVQTAADPSGKVAYGTFNNCSGGTTPWGTTLHGEENWHGYFDVSGQVDPKYVDTYKRYGLPTTTKVGRNWSKVDERFDVSRHPHEPHRHGWIVELDPFSPDAPPRKRTMLGRCKHEGATVRIAKDGRVVAYTGDDERFEYVYKFVSRDRYKPNDRAHNLTLLDHGTLYVAKFTGDGTDDGEYDGTGTWLPLTSDTKSYVPGMSVAEVLVHARIAADKVGATKMDRPEDLETNPVTGSLYIACTNNSQRTAAQTDEANPRADNRHGHVVELDESRRDETATSFRWRLILVCGDPADPGTYYGGYDKTKVSAISCPDNVAFDKSGNLWISTDGNALGSNDGLFATPVRGPERGHVKQFLTVPIEAETCGPIVSTDQRTVFVAVQHPGEGTGASPDNPISHWPYGDQPRSSVVCVWRD